MSQQTQKIFIDTNIFLYHLFDKSSSYAQKSAKFFKEIENSVFIGATSSFTRSEFLAVVKRKLCEKNGTIPTPYIINSVLKMFDDFIDNMGIEYFESDELANSDGKLFEETHKQVESSKPIQVRSNWRALGAADCLLIAFAERSNSNKIMTNDIGFKGISSSVQPMILMETY